MSKDEKQSLNPELSDYQPDDDTLSKVSNNLSAIPNDVDDEDDKLQDGVSPDKTEGDEIDKQGEIDDGDETGKDDGTKKETVIPEAYLRAAKHQGMSEEDVVELVQQNPEKGLKILESIYKSTNYITSQTAALGRMAHTKAIESKNKVAAESKPSDEVPIKLIDVAALEKEYGEEHPATIALAKALNSTMEQLVKEVRSVKIVQPTGSVAPTDEDIQLWNTVTNFFGGDQLKDFNEFYGTVEPNVQWNLTLTGTQLKNRMKVVEMTDQIIAGAELQGRKVGYDEALYLAHCAVSEPVITGVVREKLGKSVKQRNKGITVRSQQSASESPDNKTGKKSEEKAVKTARKGLARIFGTQPD